MRAEDIRAYLGRDWEAVAELKDRFWLEQRRLHGVAGAMQVANELRRAVLALRPTWPSEEEREEDIAVHVRVGEVLRRAHRARGD
jgi:hypothetical protein